jgi:D-alanine-D-alanine ligase
LRAVLLVDEGVHDSDDPNFTSSKWSKQSEAEYSVSDALRKLGHHVVGIPATCDVIQTISTIKEAEPDFVFNMVEEIGGRRDHDSTIVQALELLRIPYTGASPDALMLARNKNLAKLVVAQAGILVPQGAVIYGDTPLSPRNLTFPAILKPLILDGSEGVTTTSYIASFAALRKSVSRLMRLAPLLCEEYIPGRELIVTMSGTTNCTVDSICEMVFPEKSPVKYATSSAKFNEQYRARFGILYNTPTQLAQPLRGRVVRAAKTAYQALRIRAYAKLEFRIDGDKIVFIEANPNSQLSRFAKSSDFASIGYERFIGKIIRMAFERKL